MRRVRMQRPFITAIVTGAGLGMRMGHMKNKMLIEIDGGRVLHCIARALLMPMLL